MKNSVLLTILLILVAITSAMSQTTYNVLANTTTAALKMPEQCIGCTINVADGATLTFSLDHKFKNSSFKGGKIAVNEKSLTAWEPVSFTNTVVEFTKKGAIVASAPLNIEKSQFIFKEKSTATFWSQVNMNASSLSFIDDAAMEATSAVSLKNLSTITAGDGTKQSNAVIKFNGGTLSEFDFSYVTLLGANNTYFNWASYYGNGTSYQTTNNTLNCGTAGKNTCSAPVVYGPATMTVVGVSSNATTPVVLSAFDAKAQGTTVRLNWTTDNEQRSSHFLVERSNDGNNWIAIGKVNAAVNSSTQLSYSFSDVLKTASSAHYRLRLVDQDGSYKYSSVKTVKLTTTSTELSVFPNPATDYVVVNSKSTTAKIVLIINQNDQIIRQASGSNNIRMSVAGLVKGFYAVKVMEGNTSETLKLMIK